jgi:hypothetical protein
MTAVTLTQPDTDLRRRLRPSREQLREQLRVAAAMFRVATEDVTSVVVPVVAPDAAGPDGVGPAPRLEYPGGYWLADRGSRDGAYSFPTAREAAAAAARAHVRRHGERGVPGWSPSGPTAPGPPSTAPDRQHRPASTARPAPPGQHRPASTARPAPPGQHRPASTARPAPPGSAPIGPGRRGGTMGS